MKINSLAELKKIREEHQKESSLIQSDGNDGNSIEILVGMATCGISSGAKETYDSITEELAKQSVRNAKVVPVGCIGYCHSEPTVQVNIQGQKPVLYGNVKKEQVQQIIQQHILGGQPVESLALEMSFNRA